MKEIGQTKIEVHNLYTWKKPKIGHTFEKLDTHKLNFIAYIHKEMWHIKIKAHTPWNHIDKN
jgi:hypothetical protein